jgi:heptaprenyl diphosphate synthase
VVAVSAHAAPFGIDFDDPVVESAVLATLSDVEIYLREVVHSEHPLVAEAAVHLMDAGGKRFRPILVALAAQAGHGGTAAVNNTAGDKVVGAAVVVELTHLATLYHDDVMDEADVRRSAPSANKRWSNSVAILVGDYLFARAASVAADLGPEAVRIQAATFARLVHGQIAETVGPAAGQDAVGHLLHVVAEKTGSLIATSARFGAMFGGATPPQVDALARYGELIGIAFQLSDDLIDISSESVQSGKTPGTDLREGVHTLPMLYALASDDSDAGAVRLREILSAGPVTHNAVLAEALALLRESAGLKQARQTVRGYSEQARAQLTDVPDSPARRALESICDFIADRTG